MNAKQKLLLGILTLIALTLVTLSEIRKDKEVPPQMASMNFIKCTVAQFLLNEVDSTKQIAPLFSGLGDLTLPISTDTPEAQTFFDQGLKLLYAFNHAEAHRSFLEASRKDSKAAMTFWGQAYALGPNINDPFPDTERKLKAYESLQSAQNAASNASPKEQALIQALASRYSADTTVETATLNVSYMEAMAKVAQEFPQDADVQTLYAASVMNTVPWNYWDKEGNPSPNILEAKKALETAISINADHPGAHHYYIHMVELPQPDLAVPSADRLRELMPSAGHIVHMPSHIYIRVGRYLDAVKSNQEAILADEDYISQCYSQGLYPLAYYPHNIHFLWSAASLLGDSKIALEAAKKTAEKVPVGDLRALPFLQNFAATPLLAYVRFGKWNEILTTPSPNHEIKHLKMIWHYARGIAFIRKGNAAEAREELQALEKMMNDPDMETLIASGFDNSATVAKVAYEIVAGELAALEGDHDNAITHLQKAVTLEDNLIYTEPSTWYIPPRQNLGAILVAAEQYEAAEKVYQKDLEKLRQNGWSLMGLYKSLQAQGKMDEANKIKKEFDKAWQYADFEIDSSIL